MSVSHMSKSVSFQCFVRNSSAAGEISPNAALASLAAKDASGFCRKDNITR